MEGIKFFQKVISESSQRVSLLAVVNTYDNSTNTATVKPLVEAGDEELPLLITVPVAGLNYGGFEIVAPLKKGDIVLVLFLDHDSDKVIMSGTGGRPNSTRTHSLDDAIIISGITPINNTRKVENGLSIKGENNHFILHSNGDIDIKGKNINIDGNINHKGGGL